MMIANGLQINLLGVRSVIENFNVITTGIFMSGYFVGYFLGSHTTPLLVSKVGHIRVFAAFASLASLSILLAVVFVNPIIWTLSRFISGFSLVSCYVVAESWLNDRATNKTRGQILSAYMITIFIGMGIGMLLLNISTPKNYEPFILVSLLMSLALVPILLTKRSAPKFKKIGTISVKELYKISPLGTVSSFCTGAIHSGLFSLTAVYAAIIKFTIFEISILLFIITISGVITQAPIGYLSDKYDRRTIIVIVAFLASIFAVLAVLIGGSFIALIIITFIFGGLTVPLYALAIAHTNDFLEKDEMVAASAGIQLAGGVGLTIGPIIGGLSLDLIGASGFWIFLFLIHALLGVFGLFRMQIREAVPLEEQGSTVLVSSRTTATLMELYPDAEESIDPVE